MQLVRGGYMKIEALISRLEALKSNYQHVFENPVDYKVDGETSEDEQQFIQLQNAVMGLLGDIYADDLTDFQSSPPQYTTVSDTIDGAFEKLDAETFEQFYARTDAILIELMEASSKLPEDTILNAVVTFPMADGNAYYKVIKESPIVLEHLPVADAWEAVSPTIRGLTRDDILAQIKRQRYVSSFRP